MRELRAGRLERERPVVARRSPEELIGYDGIGAAQAMIVAHRLLATMRTAAGVSST